MGIRTDADLNKEGITTPLNLPKIEPTKILEQKYSIHPSPTSPTKINVIKQRKLMASGRVTTTRNYTRAIKGRDGFAFIFERRCGDLKRPHYISHGKNNISIGSYDPSRFTLIYGVFVGARDLEFVPTVPHGTITITQKAFNNVRLIILSTFLGIPTQPSFFAVHLHTLPSSIPDDPEAGKSLSVDECIEYFKWHASDQRKEMLQLLKPTCTPVEFSVIEKISWFFRTGFTNTREYGIRAFIIARERGFYKITLRLGKD